MLGPQNETHSQSGPQVFKDTVDSCRSASFTVSVLVLVHWELPGPLDSETRLVPVLNEGNTENRNDASVLVDVTTPVIGFKTFYSFNNMTERQQRKRFYRFSLYLVLS